MSIFDVDANIEEAESYVKFKEAQEKMLLRYVIPGTVKCVVFAPDVNIMLKKLHEIYGISIKETSFATYIQTILDNACLALEPHKHRRVVSLDCKGLKKVGNILRICLLGLGKMMLSTLTILRLIGVILPSF